MKLGFYDEIVGTLKEIQEKNDQLHLTFIFKKTIEIPKDALPVEKLNKCIDTRIGILYTGEKYLMSKIVAKIEKKDKYK
jgi:hypothetical protein